MSKIQLPEAELVRRTFTVKEIDLPPHVRMTKRSLLRWFALASGWISEQESRQTILDVMDALFYFHVTKKMSPNTGDIQQYVKEKTGEEISEKLLRYHLKRLLDSQFIVRDKQHYKFNPSPNADPTDVIASYNHWISQSVHASTKNIESALEDLTKTYQ